MAEDLGECPQAIRVRWVADGYQVDFGQLNSTGFASVNRVLFWSDAKFEWNEDRSSLTLTGGPGGPALLQLAREWFRPVVPYTTTGRVGRSATAGEAWLDLYLCGYSTPAELEALADNLDRLPGLQVVLRPAEQSRRLRVWGVPHTIQRIARSRMHGKNEAVAPVVTVPADWLAGLEKSEIGLAVTMIES